MAELENELVRLDAQLRRHLAAAPPEREENTELLAQLPHAEVDLNALAGDRLRRFLDAFRVEIHYDVRTGRAVFRAEISGEMLDQLTQQIHWAEVERSAHARARRQGEAKEEGGEGSPLIMGSSFRLCPRRVSYNMGTRRHQPERHVRGGRRCVAAAATRPAVAMTRLGKTPCAVRCCEGNGSCGALRVDVRRKLGRCIHPAEVSACDLGDGCVPIREVARLRVPRLQLPPPHPAR